MLAHTLWLRDWAPIVVAVAALLFTVASFWWLNARRGRLEMKPPQTYAALWKADRMILLFPFAFYNTGARDYVVRDMRIRFADESVGIPLEWERCRAGVNPSDNPGMELAAPFVVPGRSAVRVFAEFERKPGDRGQPEARPYTLRLEGLTDREDDWHTLLTFDLTIRGKDAETMTRSGFIAYRNHTRWPVPAPSP